MVGGTLLSIDIDRITESKTNPKGRTSGTAFDELVASVREHGVLQPVLLRQRSTEKLYELIAGHRRLAAARIADLQQIPALVVQMSDSEALELQLVENLQRADLHPLDEAEGYARLLKANYDVAKIAAKVGRSPAYVYDRMKLLSLTKEAKQLFRDERFTAGHAVLLARLKPADQERALDPHARAALFIDERGLFDPNDGENAAAIERGDRYHGLKACTVRELQAWIDQHVRFDPEANDVPQLFPDTALAVKSAREESAKVVHITRESYVQQEAREGERIIGPRSWKDARAKSCDKAVVGVIVIGPGRGTSLPVCTTKTCRVHWAAELLEQAKRKKQAEAAGGSDGKPSKAERDVAHEKMVRAQEREAQLRKLWEKAAPKFAERLAECVRDEQTDAKSVLGRALIDVVETRCELDSFVVDNMPAGNSAEELVRHLAFAIILDELLDAYDGPTFAKQLKKSLGFDAFAVLKEVEQAEQADAPAAAEKKPAKKRGAK